MRTLTPRGGEGERLSWTELRKLPRHVRKQSPVGPYVADFPIHRGKLVKE
jgi:very-short-patch-repair endonuclease